MGRVLAFFGKKSYDVQEAAAAGLAKICFGHGPMVEWSRRCPLKAEAGVQIPLGLPFIKLVLKKYILPSWRHKKKTLRVQGLFFVCCRSIKGSCNHYSQLIYGNIFDGDRKGIIESFTVDF